MVEFNGLGHSAAIHTEDHELSKRFGHACKAIRIIENAPSTFGGIEMCIRDRLNGENCIQKKKLLKLLN